MVRAIAKSVFQHTMYVCIFIPIEVYALSVLCLYTYRGVPHPFLQDFV